MALNRAAFMRKARRFAASFIPFVVAVSTLSAISIVTAPSAQAVTATATSSDGTTASVCNQEVGSNSNVVVTRIGSNCVVEFKNVGSTTWTAPSSVTSIQVMVVAGGGSGGGSDWTGGGGAGGVIVANSYPVSAQTPYTVVVGGGGAAQSSNFSTGNPGGNSSFDGKSAIGGGGGAGYGWNNSYTSTGGSGGSGGGSAEDGSSFAPSTVPVGGASTQTIPENFSTKYGNKGGDSGNLNGQQAGAGGGGAGSAGGNVGVGSTPTNNGRLPGNGGDGVSLTFGGKIFNVAAGGGGASYATKGLGGSAGGTKIGGDGAQSNASGQTTSTPGAGAANTGSGGGGMMLGVSSSSGAGGSGIVVLAYALTTPGAPTSLVATAGNAQVGLTWSAPTSIGSSAITDYRIETSQDGSNFTTFVDGTSTSTSATVTGLTNGTTYTFRVSTISAVGTGSASSTVIATPIFPACVSPTTVSSGGFTYVAIKDLGTCTWTPQAGVSKIDLLVVAGGGGGGSRHAGGGGAGGLRNSTNLDVNGGALTIVVGDGGNGGGARLDNLGNQGANGSDSSVSGGGISTLTAIGGGGGTYDSSGSVGGSGGGGGCCGQAPGNGTAGQGNSGSSGFVSAPYYLAGGGGGAGAAGVAATGASQTLANPMAYRAGLGGVGAEVTWIPTSVRSTLGVGIEFDSKVFFAGGGGGGTGNSGTGGTGGTGGGGTGATTTGNPGAGTSNTGGGGGGAGLQSNNTTVAGGKGGSGVVVIRYISNYTVTYNYDSADAGNTTVSSPFTPGGTAITLPTPSKTGFSFSGWYTAASGGSLVGLGGASYSPSGTSPAIPIYARWSAPSGTVNVPSAPNAITATGSNGGITVSWTAPLSNGTRDISGYQVEYSTTGAAGSWTVASSTIANNATSFTITGLANGSAYYVRIAALFDGGRGAYGYPWQKIYGTVNSNRNGSNLITYETGFGTATGDAFQQFSAFTRVRYLMKASYGVAPNPKIADVDFAKTLQNPSSFSTSNLDSTTSIRIPSTGTDQTFTIQGDVYDLSVWSNVASSATNTVVHNGYGFNGRVEIWPWNYGTDPAGTLSTRSAGTYDDSDTPSNNSGIYGSFQLHNITNSATDYRQTVLAWNNHAQTPEIGFGNQIGGSGHSDWTFCSSNGTCGSRTQFSLEIFVNAPITAAANSTDATLSALTISSGTFSPSFASATTSYTASVTNGTSSITVTPTRNQANATITVNGTAVTSGSASASISLNIGSNTITVIGTAQDGTTTSTYTVTVTRAAGAATKVAITRASVGTQRGAAFTTQPQITVQDSGSNTVTSSSAVVTATVSAGGTLVGTTTATASSGVATFTGLGVNGNIGTTYTITYTVSGLTVATATVTLTGTTCDGSFTCQVGDTGPGGGIIFYVAPTFFTQVGATGSMCTTNCKYLEAAPGTWSGGSTDPTITWATGSNQSTAVEGADGTAIGTGYQNSVDIANQSGNVAASSAAVAARGYTTTFSGITYSDWFLPSHLEMQQLCTWQTAGTCRNNPNSPNTGINASGFGVGSPYYWKSSEVNASNAQHETMLQGGGQGSSELKSIAKRVRPIRAFGPAPIVISTAAIAGVTAPVAGATPVTTTTAGTGYTGTVTWSGSPTTFATGTTYTATITLTAAAGYTLTGVSENFFTVSGATTDTNPANSGVVTAVFPATASSNVATLSALVLSSGTLSPTFASGTITYTASVANSVATGFTVTPTTTQANATTVQYLGATGTTAFTGALSVGTNVIRTVVTAQNGTTTSTYTVTVTRAVQVFTITYAAGTDGTGTGPSSPSTVNDGATFTTPANTFTRTGYSFAGWSDGSSTYAASATYPASGTVSANVTLTATWNPIACTISTTSASGLITERITGSGSCVWTTPTGISAIEVAVVGGGGGGGFGSLGAGGGAGEVLVTGTSTTVSSTVVSNTSTISTTPAAATIVTIGSGGTSGAPVGATATSANWNSSTNPGVRSGNGTASSFGSISATGGGGGGGDGGVNGAQGGSGGGGANGGTGGAVSSAATPSGWTSYKTAGSNGAYGGGGGAGGAGSTTRGGSGITVLGIRVAGGGGGWGMLGSANSLTDTVLGGNGRLTSGSWGYAGTAPNYTSPGATNTGTGGGAGAPGGSGTVVVRYAAVVSYTYDANGGTGTTPTGGSAQGGTTFTTVANPFIRSGFTFSGWYTTSTGTGGTAYTENASNTMQISATAIVLFAKWTANPAVTSFSSQSGTASPTGTTITFTGTNLNSVTGVAIGNVTATISGSSTSTQLIVTIPSSTVSGTDIVLTSSLNTITLANSIASCGTSGNYFISGTSVVGTNYCVGTVEVSAGVATIAQCAFATAIGGNCGTTSGNSITTVSLPTSLRTISAYGFLGSNLTSITLPEGLTTIGNSAFYMGGTYSLHIPSTVTTINTAFYKTNARSITFASGSQITSVTDAFRGMPNIFSLAIPDSVTTIVGTLNFSGSFATLTMRGVTTLPAGSLPATLTCIVTSAGNTAVNGYSYAAFSTAPLIVTDIANCPPPTITSLSVTSGSTSGSTSTVITGTHLINATGVTVGGNAATITARSTTSLTISTPAGTAGAVDVVVTTQAASVTRSNGFTYLGASISITYNSQSGTSVTSGTTNVGGTIASAPTAPTRTNYTFSGWSTTSSGSVISFPYIHGQTANFTLFAIWIGNSLTVTYDSQSGSSVTSSSTNVGASISAAPAAPTRSNFTFAGWAETIGGTAITFPYTHGKTANFTLYAKWTANAYVVTYVYNSATGGNSTETDSFTTGGTLITLPTPTRTGYTFAGWFAESTFATSIGMGGASYGPTGSSLTPSVFAKWTAINYTVTYATTNSTGGTAPTDSANYNIGNSVAIKGNTGSLVRAGYTFTGWTAASDGTGTLLTSGSPFTVSNSNMTFYPKWSANTYTITYNKNGASGSPTASTASYTSGSTEVTLTTVGTMAKTGFDFTGWSTSPTGTALTGTYTTTSDITLYAVWTIKSIAITFSKGIASGVTVNNFPSNTNLDYGSTLTLAGNLTSTVVISGAAYAFAGWSLSGNIYRGGDTYLVGVTPPTFTAEWVKVFAVRYALNGGTAAAGSSEVDAECIFVDGSDLRCTENQVITVNAAPTRAGYTFGGWVNQGNQSVTAAATTTITTTNYLFYATWSPVDYAVSYNVDGGSAAPASFTKRIGETFTVASAPTKTGYRFNGWSDGTNNYGAGATYFVGSSTVSLTAQWIANVYTVIYDWNGGIGSSTSNATYTVGGSAITLPSGSTHTKDGFTFSGWSETSNGSLISGGYTPTADATLYAIWGTGSYTTTYSASGGTVATASEAVLNGSSVTLPTPTRDNFVFEGWFTASTGGTKVGNAGASHRPTQSRTLHAQWTQSSLYGIAPAALSRVGVLTASDSGSTTTTHSNSNSSVTVLVPAAALPAGTTINIDRVSDLSRAQNAIAGDNSYIISVVVSWITSSGTVPTTNPGKAISVTITNSTIKAGASVYGIVAGNVSFLTTATENGTVTVSLTSDPEVVVIATKPNAPTSVTATSNGNKQSIVSWTAPTSDGGSVITGYTATSNSGATCSTTTTSCSITGLADGTAYTFTVTATNSVGTSVASSAASATTAGVYTVTFNPNGGSTVSNGSFLTASTVAEPTAPTKAGYTFAGWASVDGGVAESFPFAPGVASNITMYARWDAADNAVTFNSKSGSPVTSSTFASGGTVAEPTAPSRDGYTFAGWSATDGGSVVTFPYAPGVVTAITLYAKWTAADNAVTFDSKSGSPVTASTFASGGTVAEPTAPTRDGYTFAGWSATDGGSVVTFPYAPGVVTAITLYAKWTAVSQNVSGGGGGSSNPGPTTPSEPAPTGTPVRSNVTVAAPVTVVGDKDARVVSVEIKPASTETGSKPPSIKIDVASEKFIAEVKVVEGKLVLTPETGFSGKKTVTVTVTENGVDRFIQIPLTVLPEAVTKPVLTPTAANRSIIRWTTSPNATSYTVLLNGKRVCTTSASSCSVSQVLGPNAEIEIVSNGGDRTFSEKIDADFRQNVPVPITRLVSATITKATLTRVDTKALDKIVALVRNQGFGTIVISEITTTKKTASLAAARIEAIKKYIDDKTGSREIKFEIVPATSRTYFNNIAVKG